MTELAILVVDDEEDIRESVTRALRSFKVNLSYLEEEFTFTIDSAASAEEGLEMIRAGNYAVLLLDNQLPGMNGTELLKILSEMETGLVTIMITAFASIETAITATKHGAYDFVTKPFTPQELRDSVFKAVKHQVLTQTAQKLIEEKRKVRFQFISVLSHELKSPLAAVTNYLKLMDRQILGADIGAYNEFIERSLIRISDMEKLIYDLLDLTRIESGEKKRQLEPVALDQVIQTAIERHQDEFAARKLTITTDIDALTLQADTLEIDIIINNLLTNAIKYNREGGNITVRLKQQARQYVLAVSDTGIGIAPKDQEKLFGEFSRIRNEHTLHISGSGIGLSTVKKVVALYGGEIRIDSAEGKGSTFTVILPLDASVTHG